MEVVPRVSRPVELMLEQGDSKNTCKDPSRVCLSDMNFKEDCGKACAELQLNLDVRLHNNVLDRRTTKSKGNNFVNLHFYFSQFPKLFA